MIRVCAAALTLLFSCLSAKAYDPLKDLMAEVGDKPKDESTWEFISEQQAIAPGKKFSVALALSHPEGWHSYYVNSGGIEFSPEFVWQLPTGFQAGAIQWPVPHVTKSHPKATVKSYQYAKDEAFLIVEMTAPVDVQVGTTVTLKGKATWQICNPSCKQEEAEIELSLPVAAEPQINAATADAFKKARSRQGDPSPYTFSFEKSGGKLQLVIHGANELKDPHYIANHPMILAADQQVAVKDGDVWRIDLSILKKNEIDTVIEPTDQLGGFFQYSENGSTKTVVVPSTRITKKPAAPLAFSALLPVLLSIFLGGMILNFMPCVFPVIGIKILGFVQNAGQDRRKVILHGLVYTFGVVVSFWILSGILFAAKSAVGGEELGWAFQLQNQGFVLALMVLMFVMGLNLAGVFEIGTSATGVGGKLQMKKGMAGTFFSGLLATVVATPCSAPILGPAIGTAVGLPAVQYFICFTCMALGLALPYLILSIFPKLVDYLPRPGAWMETFKQAMSFLLFASAAYLLWVYGAIIDFDNLLNPLAGLVGIAIACWIYGRWTGFQHSLKAKAIAITTALAFLGAGIWYSYDIKKSLDWQTWSEPELARLLEEEERPVYVDFTAKWCATCQVNKRIAYTEEVIKMFEERGIVALKADKTKPSAAIEKALEELDRSAIPVNVLYIPGKDPIITQEALTPSYMKELIEKHVPKNDAE